MARYVFAAIYAAYALLWFLGGAARYWPLFFPVAAAAATSVLLLLRSRWTMKAAWAVAAIVIGGWFVLSAFSIFDRGLYPGGLLPNIIAFIPGVALIGVNIALPLLLRRSLGRMK